MNCQDIVRILDDGNIGTLSATERDEGETHALSCRHCARRWLAHTRMADLPVPPMPSELAAQVETLVVARARGNVLRFASRLMADHSAAVHRNAGITQIADVRARQRSRYMLVGALVAVGAAAAGLWTQWSGTAMPAAAASLVADALVAPVQPVAPESSFDDMPRSSPPASTDRVPAEQPVPDKAAALQPDADNCCVPALPGVEGYPVPVWTDGGKFAVALDAEAEDPFWAPDVERRIRVALQKAEELRGMQAMIVCRSTACGLLFIVPPGGDFNVLKDRVKRFQDLVASEFGFDRKGTLGMHQRDGREYVQVRLIDARTQERLHPEAMAAMSAATASEEFKPPPVDQARSYLADPGVRAAERLAREPVDRSIGTDMLENEIQKEALSMVGTELNRLTVECRVSTCVVVVGFPPGVSPDLSPMVARMSRLVGPATIANVSELSGPDGATAAIELKR